MVERYPEVDQNRPPIFEISRTNPQESWKQVMGYPFQCPDHLFFFDSLGKRIDLLIGDDEIQGIQVVDNGEDLNVHLILEDVHAETNFSGIFQAGLRPDSLCFLNGYQVEDALTANNPLTGQTVGVLKFVA